MYSLKYTTVKLTKRQLFPFLLLCHYIHLKQTHTEGGLLGLISVAGHGFSRCQNLALNSGWLSHYKYVEWGKFP